MAVSIAVVSIGRMVMRLGDTGTKSRSGNFSAPKGDRRPGCRRRLAWLVPEDIYPPDDPRQIRIRNPSLLENPFELAPGSSGLSALIVTHRDAKEPWCSKNTDSTMSPPRAGRQMYDPLGRERYTSALSYTSPTAIASSSQAQEDEDRCPSESEIEAYLNGETVDGMRRPVRDTGEERGSNFAIHIDR